MKWKNIDRTRSSILEDYRKKTPYEILRVDRSASAEDVTKAYRELLQTYHPDKSHDFLKKTNEEITKLINHAYESILREKNARR